MGEQRSLIGHLTLTAWESWSAEPHWKNAVIIALVGSVAFSLSTPPASSSRSGANAASPSSYSPSSYTPPTGFSGGSTSYPPLKAKPGLVIKVKPSEQGGEIRKLKEDEKLTPAKGSSNTIKPSFKSGD